MTVPLAEPTIQHVLSTNYQRDEGGDFLTLFDSRGNPEAHSYTALLDRAAAWTALYRLRGLRPGDRIVVVLPHSIDLYAAYIGAMIGGMVPAMFAHPSPKLSETVYFETVDQLLANAKARLLVCYPEAAERFASLVDALPTFDWVLTPQMLNAETDVFGTLIGEKDFFPAEPEDTAFLQYSSGTTGLKKGVAISHRALLWQSRAYVEAIGADETDTIVSWLPLYHDMGLIACLFLPLIKRIKLVAMSPFDWVRRPAMWAETVDRYNATLSWLPNFAFNFIANNLPADCAYDLTSLRGVINCSEPVLAESHALFVERLAPHGFMESAVAVSYALAENTFAVTSGGFGRPPQIDLIDAEIFDTEQRAKPTTAQTTRVRRLVSSGRALPETSITIQDDQGNSLEDRWVGEIVLSSPSLFNGYDDNPEATDAACRQDGFHSGDLGYLADGELFVVGRAKDLIIVGGRNIYPQDVEAIVGEVAGVIPGRVVAFGVEDRTAGTESLIVVAESADATAGGTEIATEIRQTLAAAMETAPSDIRIVDHGSLVKSTSGKIARAANKERYLALREQAEPQAPAAEIAPINGIRQAVLGEIRAAGSGHSVNLGDDTPLITSGLVDSFGLVNLIAAVERAAGLRIPDWVTRDVANLDSIAALAGTVDRIRGGEIEAVGQPCRRVPNGAGDIAMDVGGDRGTPRFKAGFWTLYYKLVFRRHGIRFGKGLRVMGPLMLRLDGNPRNISIGDNVTLMPWVDLKIREQGRITLGHGVVLDSMVRLVAANDAELRLGDRVQLAIGNVVNAGTDVIIGRDSVTAGYCTIVASEHKMASGTPIMQQGYDHRPIYVGADVWIAANVLIRPGSRIGDGAVIGAQAIVNGDIPGGAIAAGQPARAVKFRHD